MKKAFNLILFLAFTLSAAAQFEGDGDGFGDGNFQLPGIINLSSNQAGAGSAIDFDGINDFVSVDHYSNLNSYSSSGGLTIEFWFSPDSLHGTQSWLSKTTNSNDSGYVIKTVGTQMLCSLKMGSIWETVSFTVVEGTWQHVAFVASENQKVVAYLDGIQQGSSTSSSNFTSNTNSLILGSGNGAEYANGKMDELRIWYVDLDSTTIRDYISKRLDFNHPHISLISDISLYFQFDENTGDSLVSSLTDDSPGVLSNMNFNNAWVRSGAALGDESSFTFGGITLSHTLGSGAVVTVSNFTTTPTSISIFREGNTPEGTTFPTELDSSIISEYFGVRVNGGGTFDVEIDYSGSEEYGSRSPVSTLRAYRRDNSSSASYTAASGFFGTDVSASTITINTNSSGEFIFGFTNNSYPEESGSGYALDFDGLNQSGNIGNRTDLSFNHDNSFTIEAWVSTTASSQRTIVSKMLNSGTFRGYDFLIRDGQLELYLISTWSAQVINVRGNDLVNDGKWHHVAVTYDGTNNVNGVKLYVDGVVQSNNVLRSGSIAGGLTNSADVVLGNRGGSHDFIGQMDEVRVWSNDLSEMEIRNWMSRKISSEHPQFSELKAYFKFDENTGTTAQDLITSNQASLINTPTWVVSGAELGDDVTFTYGGTFVLDTLSSGTVVSIENFTGNPDAVFLYVVSDTAKNSSYPNIANFSIIDSFQYVGVNMIGGTSYDVVFDFSNNPAFTTSDFVRTVVAFKRSNGADGSWEQVTGPLSVDVANKTLTIEGQTGTEYVLGFTNTTFPNEPGSGYALSFDGIDDYVRIPNGGFTLGNEFTIQTWVSPNSGYGAFANGHVDIVGQWGSGGVGNAAYHLSFNPSGQVLFQIHNGVSNSTAVSSSVVSINEWTHVAVTRSALGAVQIYINGVADGSIIAGSAPQVSTNYDIIIGASATLTNNVNASIDEVSFWNTDLSQSEIRDWMTKKLNSFHPSFSDLISYYRFDENAGTTLTDLVGGNDGTLTNGPIWLTSGAALGDSSAYTYGGTEVVLNYPNSDQLTINNFSGSPDGAHLFYVNDTSNVTTTPDGIDTMLTIGYGGSFVVGGTSPTYDVKYSYNSNPFTSKQEEEVVLVKRGTNADPGYSQGNLSERVTAGGQVGEANVTGRAEFLPAIGANNALSFDGVDDQVAISHNSDLNIANGDFTLEAWIYPRASGNETILSKGHGGGTIQDIYIFQIQSNKIALELGGATSGFEWQYSNTNVPLNQWSHVAASFDYASQTVTFFLNGTQDGVKTYSLAGINNTDANSLYIGRQGWSCNCNFFDGKIDEVKIWGRALCSEELNAIRNCETPFNQTDLMAYYNFNQGSASAQNASITALVDNSPEGNDGTLTNMSLNGTTSNWVAGSDSVSGACSNSIIVCGGYPQEPGSGYALDFDGTNDYVSLSTLPSGLANSNFAVECWLKVDNSSTFAGAVTAYSTTTGGFAIHTENDGKVSFIVGTNTSSFDRVTSPTALTEGTWNHIVGVKSGTQIMLYINGINVGSVASNQVITLGNLEIGRRYTSNAFYLDGSVDEVRVWGAELSEIEIRDWMTKKLDASHPEYTNLTAYYRFDDNTGTTLTDLVGGNDGTLTNMDPATDWVYSGAALGDNSVYTYGGSSVSANLSNQNVITVDGFEGSPDGIHVYSVTDTAQGSSYPTTIANADSTAYFGVFMVGGTSFNLTVDYSNNNTIANSSVEQQARLLDRDRGEDTSWETVAGEMRTNIETNEISIPRQTGQEYVTGFVSSVYPKETGAGYTLDFDGNNDYIEASANAWFPDDNIDDFTFETWVKLRDITSFQGVISYAWDLNTAEPHSGLWVENGQLRIYTRNDNNASVLFDVSGGTLETDEWTHLAFTKSGNSYKGYVNGIEVASATPTITGSFSRNKLLLGATWNSTSYQAPIKGQMDEARIWKTALSPSEIRDWMTKKINNNHPQFLELAHYYRLDENNGTTIQDLVGSNEAQTHANFGPTPTWVKSGAPIGDKSVNSYGGTSLAFTLENNNDVTVDGFVGAVDGVHIYESLDSATGSTYPDNIRKVDTSGYFGVFKVGGDSYDLKLEYENNTALKGAAIEPLVTVLKRDDETTSSWQGAVGELNTQTNISTLSSFGEVSSQYVVAFNNSNYPVEPGSGYALDFDGTDDYVNIPSNTRIKNLLEYTLSAWIKLDANVNYNPIFMKQLGGVSDIEVYARAGDLVVVHNRGNGGTNAVHFVPALPAGEWIHIAVTYAGSISTVYVNGVVHSNRTGFTAPLQNAYPIDLFRSTSFGTFYTNGSLDEVSIWDTNLSQSEIQSWMTQKITTNHPKGSNLISYYRFDENAGTTAQDLASGNTATLVNAPSWITSEAALGDTSVFAYPAATINIDGNNSKAALSNFAGGATGAHLYFVNDTSNQTGTPQGIDSIGVNRGYYGTFITGGSNPSYDINLTYLVEPSDKLLEYEANLAVRESNAEVWVQSSLQNRSVDTSANRIDVSGFAGRTEFALASGANNAIDFDGVDDYIQVNSNSSLNFAGAFTAECWFYRGANTFGSLISQWAAGTNRRWELDVSSTGQLKVHISDDGTNNFNITSLETAAMNEWHHATVVFWPGDSCNLYLDGSKLTSQTTIGVLPSTINNSSIDLNLSRSAGGGNYFNGEIDEVKIWNRALCVDELSFNRNCEYPGNTDSILVYYNFNQGSASSTNTGLDSLIDLSGNGNVGTLINMGLSGTASNWVAGSDSVAGGCGAFGTAPITVALSFNTITCNGGSDGWIKATASGANSYTYNWSNSATTDSIFSLTAGTYIVTVTNQCGATAVESVAITEPNEISLVFDSTNVSCSGNSDGSAKVTATGGTPGYTYLWSNSLSTDTISGLATGTYSVTVQDANSCSAIGSVNISTAVDTTSPVAITQNITVYLDATGSASISASEVDNGSTDNCSSPTLSVNPSSFACSETGDNIVTLTATDAEGNASTATAIVTVSDTNSPVIAINPFTLYLDNSGNVQLTDSTIAFNTVEYFIEDADLVGFSNAGACGGGLRLSSSSLESWTWTDKLSSGAGADSVVIELIMHTAITSNNFTYSFNGDSLGQDFGVGAGGCSRVLKTIKLDLNSYNFGSLNSFSWDLPDGQHVLNNNPTWGGAYAKVTVYSNNAILDNCSGSDSTTISFSQSSFSCTDIGPNNISFTVVDNQGNSSSTSAIVTIYDTTSPVALAQNITVYLDATGSASISASEVDNGSTDNCSSPTLSVNPSSFACSETGDNIVTLTATDAEGNVSTATAIVTVSDTNSPVIAINPFTLYLDNSGNAQLTDSSIAFNTTEYFIERSDLIGFNGIGACGGSLIQSSSSLEGWTWIDNLSTNAGIDSIFIEITMHFPATASNYSYSLNGDSLGQDFGVGSGGCSRVLKTIKLDVSSYNFGALNTFNWDLPDGGQSLNNNPTWGGAYARVLVYSNNTFIDNCSNTDSSSISFSQSSFSCSDIGSNNVTFSVADNQGNTSIATAIVTIADSTSPIANAQDITVYLDGAGNASITTGDIDNGSTDNCGTVTLSLDQTSFTCANLGANTVTLTANDGTNTSSATAIVTVADSTSPIANAQDITVYLDGAGNASITTGDIDNGSTDNCGTVTLSLDQTSFTCSDLGANSVTLTANDATNTSTATAVVTVVDTISPLISAQDITVYINASGTVNIDSSDVIGNSVDNCSISSITLSQTSFTCANTGANNVTVMVRDQSNNFTSATAVVTVLDTNTYNWADVNELSSLSCFGDSSASLVALVSGRTSPFNYTWNDASITDTIKNLKSATYFVTITDGLGCSDSAQFFVSEPGQISASITIDANVSCNGFANGTATANATGGTMPYTYLWSNSATSASITGVTAGTYSVTITDANGCNETASGVVTEPNLLVVSTSSVTDVTCNGAADGSALVSVVGGTSPYSYNWSNGSTSNTLSGVSSGNYSVIVTDALGCQDSLSVVINEPAALSAGGSAGTAVSCAGGSDGTVTTGASGGTAPYSFNWSTGDTTISVSGLSVGTYSVTITDANGCTITNNVGVTEPSPVVITATVDNNVICNGEANGSATASASGGSSVIYNYMWSNGASVANATGLAAGNYSVTVTTSKGCVDTTSITISEPAAVVLSMGTGTSPSCNGFSDGSIVPSVTGAVSPISYLWSNGATTDRLLNIAAGTYQLTVTDFNGCTATDSLTISEPAALVINTTAGNITCNGGADGFVDLDVTGGTTPYSYNWSNGSVSDSIAGLIAGTYSYTIMDANGCAKVDSVVLTEPAAINTSLATTDVNCNGQAEGSASVSVTGGATPYSFTWSNGDTTANILNLIAGNYTVTITDANGCSDTSSAAIFEPTVLVASTVVDSNVTCNGFMNGGATASTTGGTTPYTYQWSNGAATASITGVSAGFYSITVTDANACQDTSSVTITEPLLLTVTATQTATISCNGGNDAEVSATFTGGVGPFSVTGNNGSSGITQSNSINVSNISAGTFIITVTDANGCVAIDSLSITEPTALSATINVGANVSCNGFANGIATVSGSGGTGSYGYFWSTGDTTSNVTGLSAGSYSVTVVDANSCISTATAVVSEPSVLVANATVDSNVTCSGLLNGGATASQTGGTAPYSYLWSNADTTASISNLGVGAYSVTITDANGCEDTSSVTISEPLPISASSVIINSSCNGVSDGFAKLTATGGTLPYSYNWSNGSISDSISGVAAGTYQYTITDANSCSLIDVLLNIEPPAITGVDMIITCDSSSWIDGNTYFTSNNSATFTIVGGAANGCDSTVTLNLTINNTQRDTTALSSCDSYTWPSNNQTYTTSGIYSDTTAAVSGCDSITSIDLTINNSVVSVLPSLVECDSYLWAQNGQTYTASGVYRDTVPQVTINGCDSIYELDLTINNSTTGTDVLVACDSLTWIDGVTYFASNNTATFVLTNAQNCDSTVTLDLTINNSVVSVLPSLAECDSYLWPQNGQTYTASGVYRDTVPQVTINGCDSIYELDLTINNSTIGTDVLVACDSLTWIDGVTYFASNNTATFVLTNAQNCDSTVTLDLTINNSVVSVLPSLVACDSYLWPQNGQTYTTSGVYRDTVPQVTINGCDSIYELDLTINNSTTGTDVLVVCDSLTWIDGVTYFASNNTATFVLTNSQNCDSTVTLDLTINNSVVSVLPSLVACDSYLWPQNGQTYTTSGVYRDTVPQVTINGCDSIYELDLTINNSTTGTDVLMACDSLTWIDGVTYFASNNTATFVLTNSQNCDSTVTLDLTINNSVVSVLPSLVACDSYLWAQSGQTYTTSGVYRDTVPQVTINGCDSIYELDLTINNSTIGTDVLVACDSLTWIDGVTYFASNNTATFVLTNAQNCDSTVTLDLTINNSAIGIDTQVACDSYTWIDGTNYTSSNSTATFTITGGAANGCDSTVTLDLTINNTLRDTTSITACDSYFWSANSQTYTMSGIYSDTTQVNGCDSITSVDLTIDTIVIANSGNDQTICEVDFIPLNATPVNAGVGSWSSASGFVQFSDTNSTNATASGLIFGANDLYWSIENGSCPIVRDTVVINRANNPTVSLGPDSTVFKDDQTTLVANSSVDGQQGIAYNWDPAFYLSSSFGRTVVTNSFLEATTEFRVEVTSPEGCFGRDSILLTINEMVTFSGAFTPNGDGKNDLWLIKNIQDPSIASHEVNIFDSFGSEVFRSTNFQGWDGKFGGSDLPVASYYYSVRLNFANGESRIETGLVSILR